MKKIAIFIISIGLISVCGEVAIAAIFQVPSLEYPTIQGGINAASDGDTVLVADGVYTGVGNKNLDFSGKAITVKSENGPEHSIIDCERNGRGFWFHSGESESAVVSGFTITQGKAPQSIGSGIRCENASSPTISNCNILNNIKVGLSCVDNSSPIIVNCTFSANTGSGIRCNSSSPTIMNCNIIGNSSHLGGGGIDCENGSSPTIKDCIIADNDGYKAGGIACTGGSSPTISDSTISNNSARSYEGGGIKCVDSSPTIIRCIINDNQAGPVERGGGILVRNSWAIISDCTISNNMAGHGGGIQVNGGSPTITNCVLSGNEAGGKGGGINVNNGSPTITNCIISGNIANSSLRGGGGLYIRNASAIITNCTISNNMANEGGGIYCEKQLSQSVPTITNCIFWEDTPNEIHNSCGDNFTVEYSDIQGGYVGTGNIGINPEDDPKFVAHGHWDDNGTPSDPSDDFWVDGDYHLTHNSPCIDKGITVRPPDDDIDGHSRPQGSYYDIGADEYEYLPFGDSDSDGILDSTELATETDPLDDDTDNDGLIDGPGSGEDTDADGFVDSGETDPRNFDTDGDGIQDGTEIGCEEPEGENTDMDFFIPDADASTTTDPLNPDTDGDGLLDGEEDTNANGQLDEGETSANVYTVDMDICPEECPNYLDVRAKGILPVAVLGTVGFDINQIDPTTVLLQGVPPKRWNTEDVTRPHECLYDYEYPDGEIDLTLKFDRQSVISTLEGFDDGDLVTMTLTGNLNGGTPFEAIDSVVIVIE